VSSNPTFTIDSDELEDATSLYEMALMIAVDVADNNFDHELIQRFKRQYEASEKRRWAIINAAQEKRS